jgi:hypothetical protein
MALVTRREDGTPVVKGDTIVNFKGEEWVFQYATRYRQPGKSGKVVARRTTTGGEWSQQFYDKVFDLIVTED